MRNVLLVVLAGAASLLLACGCAGINRTAEAGHPSSAGRLEGLWQKPSGSVFRISANGDSITCTCIKVDPKSAFPNDKAGRIDYVATVAGGMMTGKMLMIADDEGTRRWFGATYYVDFEGRISPGFNRIVIRCKRFSYGTSTGKIQETWWEDDDPLTRIASTDTKPNTAVLEPSP